VNKNWREFKLSQIANMAYGKMPPEGIKVDKGYPIFTGYRIAGYSSKYTHKDSMLIVVARGVGGTGDVKISPIKSWITNLSIILDVNNNFADKKFLCELLGLASLKNKLDTGSAQSQITINSLQPFKINLPPLPTQQKIARILSAYDELIENNLQRIKLLEEMAQITYEQWFVRMKFPGHETTQIDAETGLPEGWSKKTCFEVMDVLSGGTPKTTMEEYWNGEIKFFTPKDASNGVYTEETEKTITQLGLDKCNSKLYPKDTVFITARGTVGKLNLASEPMVVNQSCYALRAKEGLTQYFLYCSLSKTIDAFKGAATGGVFDTIVVDTFKYLPFVKPAPPIIDEFNLIVTPLFLSIQNLLGQNQLLKEARDILLPRLMTGMIDVDTIQLPEANKDMEAA